MREEGGELAGSPRKLYPAMPNSLEADVMRGIIGGLWLPVLSESSSGSIEIR
jgi:hypothetical protein